MASTSKTSRVSEQKVSKKRPLPPSAMKSGKRVKASAVPKSKEFIDDSDIDSEVSVTHPIIVLSEAD
jgi:hypothetical protein